MSSEQARLNLNYLLFTFVLTGNQTSQWGFCPCQMSEPNVCKPPSLDCAVSLTSVSLEIFPNKCEYWFANSKLVIAGARYAGHKI